MNSSMKNFRNVVLAISATSLILPNHLWAKGPGGGMSGVSSHVASHSTIAAMNQKGSTSNPTISFSNGIGSDKIQSLNALATSQPGGDHGPRHTPDSSTSSSTVGSLTSKSSEIKSASISSTTLPTGGGTAKEPPVVRSANVKDDLFSDPLGSLQDAISTFTGDSQPYQSSDGLSGPGSLTNGTTGAYGDGGSMAPTKGSPSTASKGNSFTSTTLGKKYKVDKLVVSSKGPTATVADSTKIDPYSSKTLGNQQSIHNTIVKQQLAQAQPPQAAQTPKQPNPTNPPQSPMPYPSGPVFGSVSSGGSTDSTTDSATTADATTNPATTAAATGIDLVLEDVKLASPATLVAGPAYTVKFRNQGTQAAGKFQVGIFAGLTEKLVGDSPKAVVEVKSLAAGEVQTVTLRLPQKALKLIGADNKPTAFTHLFVAVDLTNAVAETDETNNTAVVEKVALETVASN